MDDVALANLIARLETGPIEVCRAEQAIADSLGVVVGTPVRLSTYTYDKMSFKHPEIDFGHFMVIAEVLRSGWVLRGKKSNVVEVLSIIGVTAPTIWKIVLKSTQNGEIFVQTFFATNRKEATRLLRKARKEGKLLRDATSHILAYGILTQ